MIHYVIGDATDPRGPFPVLVHCCNHLGYWGAGFTASIDKRWPAIGKRFTTWMRNGIELGTPRMLGEVFWASAAGRVGEDSIWIASILGQEGVKGRGKPAPIRYGALGEGLYRVRAYLGGFILANGLSSSLRPTFHMPRIGCGLAGGSWDKVEPLVQKYLGDFDVTVYDPE